MESYYGLDEIDTTRGDHRDSDYWVPAPERCQCPRHANAWARPISTAPFFDDEDDAAAELEALRADDAARAAAFWARSEAEIEADLRADEEARDPWGL